MMLAFLIREEDVSCLLSEGLHRQFKVLCCAHSPKVLAYAQLHGFETVNTENYFSYQSRVAVHQKTKEILQIIKDNSQHVGSCLGMLDLQSTLNFHMRNALSYYLWLIEITSHIIQDLRMTHIWCIKYPLNASLQPLSEYEDIFLFDILNKIAKANEILFRHSCVKSNQDTSEGSYIKKIKADLFKIQRAFMALLHVGYVLIRRLFFDRKSPWVFYTSPLYNLKTYINTLRRKKMDTVFFQLPGPFILKSRMFVKVLGLSAFLLRRKRDNLQQEFSQFLDKIENQRFSFVYKNINMTDEMLLKLRKDIVPHLFSLAIGFTFVRKLICVLRPQAIINNGCRDDDVLIAQYCNSKKISSILISHGSHTPPKNEYEHVEWKEHGALLLNGPFSHVALQTPLAEEYSKVMKIPHRGVRTGPLIWGLPIKRGEQGAEGPFLITHAGTAKTKSNLRCFIYETSEEYVQALQDLSYVILKQPECILRIKFRATKDIDRATLIHFLPHSPRIILDDTSSLQDVLAKTNLLVSFSSTVLEEALQNKIPVLLYGGGGRYQHVLGTSLEKACSEQIQNDNTNPVYHASTLSELEEYMPRFIYNLRDNGLSHHHSFSRYIYPQDKLQCLSEIWGKD
ncbi:MAG: hypothetical protein HYS98_07940 [Deltaproteobacteria bacterium]|nr:hypothetical protein [Deltaproteobacteria bacterium]